MKILFLLRGLPSAGKTFAANLLSENGKYPVLSADMYFEDSNGNYKFESSKIKYAHTWCKEQVEHCLKGWENGVYIASESGYGKFHESCDKIFVANTFTQEWEMEAYFELAEKYGYIIVSMIVENRHGSKNIHNVPDEKVQQMKNKFQIKL